MARARKKTKTMALVICSDGGLFWQGIFFLQRAAAFDPDGQLDLFYYVNEPIPKRLLDLLPKRVSVVHWKGDIPTGGYGLASYITEATLLRIFALQELTSQYDLVMYSDIDVFLRWGNLADLKSLPEFPEPVAAVAWGDRIPLGLSLNDGTANVAHGLYHPYG